LLKKDQMKNKKTAFISFFPIMPDNMGSSAVINARFKSWPNKKKIFQISHVKKINNKYIETIFIKKENALYKIFSLPKLIFKIYGYLKDNNSNYIVIEGASWIFYSFFVLTFFKILLPNTKIIYISHSVEFEIRKKYSNFFIYIFTFFFEYLVFNFASISTSVSSLEKKKIYNLYKKKTYLYPNGIILEKKNNKRVISNNYIIFCGSYLYKPNKAAIDYLNNFLMPKILKDFPDVKLVITGGGYKKKFPWLINKNIVTKKVLYNLIYYSNCMCVPLKFGSGTRIKIIESLMLGSIVLSTKKGIEGINLKYKNPPFIVDSKNGQINKLKFILKNNNKIKKISKKNKLYYKKLYSMNNITNKFLRKFI
tara:strand:+ start:961 stop:2058 length:1098 start_codon:yes stop_codon:yes gene_type:complete